jgi:septal ring factor EnvC (AmiA/AmiB activator)
MLRPEKGEGERPANSYNLIKKAPLIFTTALLVGFPLCLGQAALASTSSFGLDQQRYQPQTALGTLKQILPKTSQGLLTRPFTSLPSIGDITSLESILTGYQSRLANLRAKAAERPDLDLSASIATIEEDIDSLTDSIQQARSALTLYTTQYATLNKAIEAYNQALARETSTSTALDAANTVLSNARSSADNAAASLATATQALEVANANLDTATQKAATAKTTLAAAEARHKTATDNVASAQSLVDNLTANSAAVAADLVTAKQVLASATQAYTAAQQNYNTLNSQLQDAVAAQAVAQSNYDTNLIPDPNWTAPTYQKENIRTVENTRTVEVRTQVPTTTTTLQEQVIPNLLFNSDFSRSTEGWSGVNPGWQGSNPALIDGEIVFSYQNQTVSQGLFSGPFQNSTLTLSADWLNNDTNMGITDNYSMTVEAKDINQNTVGSATYTSTGSHDWENKSVSLVATGPVSYITVSFSGIDNGFWYGIYGPHFKNPTLQISHGQMVTETTYEEVITYEEETYYTYETYYTTEPVLTQGTIQVQINEGGESTFTAPEGAVFVSSSLRYEAIDRPECGVDIQPNLEGNSITISADNGVWGDPCGGWYKHVIGTLSYLGQPTAPLIKDPSLLPALQTANQLVASLSPQVTQAQSNLTSAQTSMDSSQTAVDAVQASLDGVIADLTTATQNLEDAQANLADETTLLDAATLSSADADSELAGSTEEQTTAKSSYDQAVSTQATAEQDVTTAEAEVDAATTELAAASLAVSEALDEKESAEETSSSAESEYTSALAAASSREPDFSSLETELAKPLPEPEPEEKGSEEIPAELSAENLMEVNLEEVDPTELTEAQAEQLVEAALETFETAEKGSAEYEQALGALFLAAQQDDIELPEELAAIPGLAAAVEVLNFLGNAGADMSPKVREESEKIVVTAVVAAGVAVQAAAGAATSAAVSAGAAAGPSGARRIGN